MFKFTILFFFCQSLLIQNAYSQCIQSLGLAPGNYGNAAINVGNIANTGFSNAALANNVAANAAVTYSGNGVGFGGQGTGEVAVLGELPVAGSTLINGNLPVIGVVQFDGSIPATGIVSLIANTPCLCGNNGY